MWWGMGRVIPLPSRLGDLGSDLSSHSGSGLSCRVYDRRETEEKETEERETERGKRKNGKPKCNRKKETENRETSLLPIVNL